MVLQLAIVVGTGQLWDDPVIKLTVISHVQSSSGPRGVAKCVRTSTDNNFQAHDTEDSRSRDLGCNGSLCCINCYSKELIAELVLLLMW